MMYPLSSEPGGSKRNGFRLGTAGGVDALVGRVAEGLAPRRLLK